MEASTEYSGVTGGEGYAVGDLDDLGEGPGFRKVRKGLDVTAFGVNAIVMPPGYRDAASTTTRPGGALLRPPRHDRDGVRRRLRRAPAGGRLRARRRATVRKIRNVGDGDAVYLCAGGKDGYVGRDGRLPDGRRGRGRPTRRAGRRPDRGVLRRAFEIGCRALGTPMRRA